MGVFADSHCGHRVGLTPPEWQSDAPGGKYLLIQQELWNIFDGWVKQYRPFDFTFYNGDMIDGKGERSGATELITADRDKQVQMGFDVIQHIGCKQIVMTYGTGYHVGNDEDWESILAREVDAIAIKSHEWPKIDGITFDLKHQASGTSSIPHGKATPLGKDKLWNMIWAEYQAQPNADIFIRSHCHYAASFSEPHWLGIFTPALQGAGTKYGGRRCAGIVHFGFTVIDIYPGENLQDKIRWKWLTAFVPSQRSGVLELSQSQPMTVQGISGVLVADDGCQPLNPFGPCDLIDPN